MPWDDSVRCPTSCLPGGGGCNPIPAKIEIRWSSLEVVLLLLYNSISRGRGAAMSKGVRIIGPDRTQLRWDVVNLDSQLPDDHRARLVWAFVEGLGKPVSMAAMGPGLRRDDENGTPRLVNANTGFRSSPDMV